MPEQKTKDSILYAAQQYIQTTRKCRQTFMVKGQKYLSTRETKKLILMSNKMDFKTRNAIKTNK